LISVATLKVLYYNLQHNMQTSQRKGVSGYRSTNLVSSSPNHLNVTPQYTAAIVAQTRNSIHTLLEK